MDEILKAQSKMFSFFLTEHLIDAVKEKGYKTTVVAAEVGIGQASMSRYINGGREMPMSVFMAICNYTGVNAQAIWNAAYVQANDPASLPEDLKRKAVNAKIDAGGLDLAALHDPDKEASGGVDAEFA